MQLSAKGPIQAPPNLPGVLGEVAQAIQTWPDVIAATHWDLYDRTRPDGADFYVDDQEIGHLHFDGEAHIATDKHLSERFIQQGTAQAFRYRATPNYRHWLQMRITSAQEAHDAITVFRANYERLVAQAAPHTARD